MNKIEKLRESLTKLFTAEGEKFCCTPNEVRRLLITLDYGRLYHALCDEAKTVFAYCSAGAACSVHQYRASKLKYTSDFDKRNELDIERFLSRRLKLKPDQACAVYDFSQSD